MISIIFDLKSRPYPTSSTYFSALGDEFKVCRPKGIGFRPDDALLTRVGRGFAPLFFTDSLRNALRFLRTANMIREPVP